MSKYLNDQNSSPNGQQETAAYLKGAIKSIGEKESSIAVFDAANIQDTLRSSDAPPVVQALMEALPEQVTFAAGAAPQNTAAVVMDAVAKAAAIYKKEHGRDAPSWVMDDAMRSVIPMVNKTAAQELGLPDSYLNGNAVFDDVSSVSGGAMSVSQAVTAIFTGYSDPIPFGGRIAMSGGMEGKIIVVGHRAAKAAGEYGKHETLDGLNAGKSFMLTQRYFEATEDAGTWTATAKASLSDANGSPIIPSAVQVLVNGLLVASSDVRRKRGDAQFTFSETFDLDQDTHTASVTVNPLTGVISAQFSPALAGGATVDFGANIDFEHENMTGKRPVVESHAESRSLRATFASGLYQVSQEARYQWNSEVRLDPTSQSLGALRTQSFAERHLLAVDRMYRVGQGFQFSFNMDKANRMTERSIASIMIDLGQALDEANLNMIARTNLNGVGVIYVGEVAASYFSNLPREIFESSGIKPRAGTYRLGRLFGKYELYYSPSRRLAATQNGFPMLCIGTSDQVGANPYITGSALSPVISPLATTVDGVTGQFYFEAGAETVNPHTKCAQSAALLNVVF